MTGETRAAHRADLAYRVPGLLIDLPVKEGERVKRGQLVARLDPTDYESSLREAVARLGNAKAKLDYDTVEYQRYIKIKQIEPGAVSDSMVNLKKASVKVSAGEVQAAEAAVAAARDQLAYTYLKAPFDGIIGKRYVDNHEFVLAKQKIVYLQDFSRIEILVDLPELMVAPIRKTLPQLFAQFTSDPKRKFSLEIKEFATQADPYTQTYRVVLVMPAPEGIRILPGMTATVIIDFSEVSPTELAVVLPTLAVFSDEQGRSCVWVVDPKTHQVHRRVVTTGELTGHDKIRIEQGLSPNEVIAISGVSMLREGMTVRPFKTSMLGE
jgi:RND family efflux transporter MFP subunit